MSYAATPMFGDPIGPWHRWRAWRPVCTFDGRWKWLVILERRRIQTKEYLTAPMAQWWQYRVVD